MAKKVYAVKAGRQTGKFATWDDCKAQVDGFSGALYKSFATEAEADAYLGEGSAGQPIIKREPVVAVTRGVNKYGLKDHQCIAYVDGSYSKEKGYYSYGLVLFTSDAIYRECGCDNVEYLAGMHNVSGELLGAMCAVRKAESLNKKSIMIVHDLEGTYAWVATDKTPWASNKQGTQEYKRFMQSHRTRIDISFKWVRGHIGVEHNEEADALAAKAITDMIHCDSASVFKDFWM